MTSWLILKGTSSEPPHHRTAPYHNYCLSIPPTTVLKTTVPHHLCPPQPRTVAPEPRTAPPKPPEPRTPAHRTPSHRSRTEPPVRTPAPPHPRNAPHRPAPPRTHRHTPRARVHRPVAFWSRALPAASPGASCCGLRPPGSPGRLPTRRAASGHDGRLRAAPDACRGLRPRREAPRGARRVPRP